MLLYLCCSDVSIWLNQAVKGMRDRCGEPVPHAHLIVLFNRICKLLHYHIKPVFVFDGVTPQLKQQTLVRAKIWNLNCVRISFEMEACTCIYEQPTMWMWVGVWPLWKVFDGEFYHLLLFFLWLPHWWPCLLQILCVENVWADTKWGCGIARSYINPLNFHACWQSFASGTHLCIKVQLVH